MDAAARFAELVSRWHDYYLLAGTAAATLMGLLFVALSLRLDAVVEDGKAHLAMIAREAFVSFLIVLFLSLLMLSPSLRWRPLATALLLMAVLRLSQLVPGLRRSLGPGGRHPGFSRGYVLAQAAIPIAASILLLAAGVTLFRGEREDALAELGTACILLLGDAARCAWDLMVRVGKLMRTRGR